MKKRILALTLGLVMVTGALTACGGKNGGSETADSKTDIEIAYWQSGLDVAWLENMIKAFETAHPEYHVTYSASANANAVTTTYGIEGDSVDLYMALKNYDTSKLEPLDDVLNATAKGESKTIGEKFDASYLALEKASDGKYYNLTYGGGIVGIVYNKKMFADTGIDTTPRTTNELATVCDKLYKKGCTPLCHYAPSGYWEFMDEVFFAQYEGFDYYVNNFYGCKDENGNSPSKEVFLKKDGRYETVKAYEKFITPEYVLAGSNSSDHINMQTQFLNGKAAMMVTGSWISNEMRSIGGIEDFEMMKTPVLSAIIDKLTTVETEGDLRKLVTAIDSVTDGEKKLSDYADGENYNVEGVAVSKADWEKVSAARNMVAANYSGSSAYIPSYSNAKEGAKEFLKFMYSDAGYKIFTDSLHLSLPLTPDSGAVDTKDWNSYEINQLDLLSKAEYNVTNYIMSKHRIFTDGGADIFAGVEYINLFCASNKADRISAEQAWQKVETAVNDNYENTWLKNVKQ